MFSISTLHMVIVIILHVLEIFRNSLGIIPVHIHDADVYMVRSYVEKAREKGLEVCDGMIHES